MTSATLSNSHSGNSVPCIASVSNSCTDSHKLKQPKLMHETFCIDSSPQSVSWCELQVRPPNSDGSRSALPVSQVFYSQSEEDVDVQAHGSSSYCPSAHSICPAQVAESRGPCTGSESQDGGCTASPSGVGPRTGAPAFDCESRGPCTGTVSQGGGCTAPPADSKGSVENEHKSNRTDSRVLSQTGQKQRKREIDTSNCSNHKRQKDNKLGVIRADNCCTHPPLALPPPLCRRRRAGQWRKVASRCTAQPCCWQRQRCLGGQAWAVGPQHPVAASR